MISLSKIAENMSVLFPDKDVDSITRKARRSFMRFIEAGGGNADQLKDDNGNMYFDEQEAVYVEAILKQLISQKGAAYSFSKKKSIPSEADIHNMIQNVLEDIDETKITEDIIQRGVNFLDMIFQLSFRRKIRYCHELVDAVGLNLEPYLYTYQLLFTERLADFLLREVIRTATEAAIYCSDLAGILGINSDNLGDISLGDLYGEPGDPIRREYEQRDTVAYNFLIKEPVIREYVEKKVGQKIEDIFQKSK